MSWLAMSPLEVVSALLSIGSVWLSMRRRVAAWPVTILASLLYGEFFREIHLYSDMLLQAVFAVCGVYGWWKWARGVQAEGTLRVRRMRRRALALSLLAGAAGTVALGLAMRQWTDASLPWLDAALTAFSLVGTVWEAQQLLENWTLWIAVDLTYIGEYAWKHAYVTAGLSAIFVGMAVAGLRDWQAAELVQAGGLDAAQGAAAQGAAGP